MYVVTNRNLQPDESPERRFGEHFNERGPNELRLAEARKVGASWQVEILPDQIEVEGELMFASEYAFLQGQARMREQKRNCLFFVHGFNTDFQGALEAGLRLETLYGVEVLLFTWPSDGGGLGTFGYRSDRRDASLSVNALDRCFEKLVFYLRKHADKACDQCFNLAVYSMGCYLFKRLMESTIYQGETLLFDNIVLLAADVNNEAHAAWVNRVQYRNRLYITINEDDVALAASRLKTGEDQKARLGHWVQNLDATNAVYLDFTDADRVSRSHAYFEDGAVQNPVVKRVFTDVFNGRRAELGLTYNLRTGAYKIS